MSNRSFRQIQYRDIVTNSQAGRVPLLNLEESLWCLCYLAAFSGAEVVTYYIGEWVGMIFYFAILFILLFGSALASKVRWRQFLFALGLVPLVRIISLAVPVGEISEIYWYFIAAIPIFIGILLVMRTLELNPSDIGLNNKAGVAQFLVALTGVGFGVVDYLILEPESLIDELTMQNVIISGIILMFSVGFVEEIVFRGVLQRVSLVIGSAGWTYIAGVYTVLQIRYGSAEHCALALVVTLFYGWVVRRTGSTVGVILSHGLLVVGLYLVFPHVL